MPLRSFVPRSELEEVAHELPSALRNDHAVRLRNTLQARRKVGRLPTDGLLRKRLTLTDQDFKDIGVLLGHRRILLAAHRRACGCSHGDT